MGPYALHIGRIGPKRGRPGQVNNLVPGQANNFALLKTDILEDFRPKTGMAIFLRARSPVADNFWRSYFTYGDVSVLA